MPFSPAPAASALKLLSTVTAASSATVDLETTFDSTYDSYMVIGSNIKVSTALNVLIRLKIGGVYLTSGYDYIVQKTTSGSFVADSWNDGGGEASIKMMNTVTQVDARVRADFVLYLFHPADSTFKNLVFHSVYKETFGYVVHAPGSGENVNAGSGVLTGIRFLTSAGNFESGKFRLYGIANS